VTPATVQEEPRTEVSRLAHHLPAAVLVALAVALLVGAPEAAADDGRLVAVALLQAVLALAWVVATTRSELIGALVLAAAAAVAADLVFLLPERPSVGGLAGVLGLALPAAVLRQMARRPREALVASLAGAVVLLCALCALAVLLREPGGLEEASRESNARVLGAIAVLVSLAASYVVVQAGADLRRPGRWALPVIQAVLPLAACAPIVLALAYGTSF
jgi:hypothetical protein